MKKHKIRIPANSALASSILIQFLLEFNPDNPIEKIQKTTIDNNLFFEFEILIPEKANFIKYYENAMKHYAKIKKKK